MPLLQIFTNVKEADLPAGYFANLSTVFQKAIGKPQQYINVHLAPNQMMSFDASTEPCAVVNIVSIGQLGLQENKVISDTIAKELAKIGVTGKRHYVIFRDPNPQDIGYNNTTFG